MTTNYRHYTNPSGTKQAREKMIVRNKPSKDFTVIRNAPLENKALSLKAKGLWAFLMSKPDGWQVSVRGLEVQLLEGKDAIMSALKELETVGLYRKSAQRNSKGHLEYQDFVYDKPCAVNPSTEKPNTENPLQVKTDRVKTDLVKTNTNTTSVVFGKPEINALFDYWFEVTGLKLTAKQQNNRRACHNLRKRFTDDELRRLIDGVGMAQADKYAPRISDFCDLQSKMNEFMLWGKKRKATSNVVVIS